MKVAVKLAVLLVSCVAVLVAAVPERSAVHSQLSADDPWDQTISVYWQKVEGGTATPVELVDLGTMLFFRGFTGEAVEMYERALDEEPELYEGWFRLGFVEHRRGDMKAAKKAYKKCLKLLTGHGPCNFYMGLLEEQEGNPEKAMDFYRRAFKFAPELADPAKNPDLMYSDLRDGALVAFMQRQRFGAAQPMAPLEPEKVAKVRSQFEPEPTPVPVKEVASRDVRGAPRPSGMGSGGSGGSGAGAPRDGSSRSRPSADPAHSGRGSDGAPGAVGGPGATGAPGPSVVPQVYGTSGEGSIP